MDKKNISVEDNNFFINGDACGLPIKDKSVDLIITHLPYITTDSFRYGGNAKKQIHYKNKSKKMAKKIVKSVKEMERVLSDYGSIFIAFGNDAKGNQFYFINEIIKKTNLIIEDFSIYNYNNGMANNQLNRNMLIWFHLTKNNRYYVNRYEVNKNSEGIFNLDHNNYNHKIDKKLHSFFPKANIYDTYNVEFANFIIRSFSRKGGIVLDPYGGTGVTAMSAMLNDRIFIHNDISDLQIKIAKKRIELSKELIENDESI